MSKTKEQIQERPEPETSYKQLVHMVNVLVCKARDGEYANNAHMKLYNAFLALLRERFGMSPSGREDWGKCEPCSKDGCSCMCHAGEV